MRTHIEFTLRLVVLPLIAAALCAAIPHWVFSRTEIDVASTMTLVAAATWGVVFVVFISLRQWLSLVALCLATASVIFVWGVHICLAFESFRMNIGFPSASDFTMAASWWGVYYSILFAVLYPLHRDKRFKTVSDQNEATQHPGMEMANIFMIINAMLVVVIVMITVVNGSYQFTFPAMGSLHLPLQTIKDSGRPGMGSGGYLPGSMMLYAVMGTAFQSGLAWLVCRIGWGTGIIKSTCSNA